jgi:hypothetical protein
MTYLTFADAAVNTTSYYYLVMTQKDFLENQGIEEILRERAAYYSMKKRSRDFWVLLSPKFIYSPLILNKIQNSNFYLQKRKILSCNCGFLNKENDKLNNLDFYAALVSQDKNFINWMQTRLGAFEILDEDQEFKTEQTKFDGVRGEFIKTIENPLSSSLNYIHPEILLNRNQNFLKLYYKLLKKNVFSSIN